MIPNAVCPGRSITDQIFTFQQTFEKYAEYATKDVYTCFADLQKAYGRVSRKDFEKCCESTVLTAACYWLSIHCISALCVRVDGVESQPFTVGLGLRQGCVPSPLFIFYMDWIDCQSRVNECYSK